MAQDEMILPIFLDDDPTIVIGRTERGEDGMVKFCLSPEFMASLAPNVHSFTVTSFYARPFEAPIGVSLTVVHN
jgi:hypothetical protein